MARYFQPKESVILRNLHILISLLLILFTNACSSTQFPPQSKPSPTIVPLQKLSFDNWTPYGKPNPKIDKEKTITTRGWFKGWETRSENTRLYGTVSGGDFFWAGVSVPPEVDWNIYVIPGDNESLNLLAIDGYEKSYNYIEVEVEPKMKVPGKKFFKNLLSLAQGQQVTIYGTYVNDLQHAPKPEIHPMKSMFFRDKDGNYHFVAITEASGDRAIDINPNPVYVPHRLEPQDTSFELQLPVPYAQYTILEEINEAASKKFEIKDGYLYGNVNTGKIEDGKGFYYVKFSLYIKEPVHCHCYTCTCACSCACPPNVNPCQ